MAEAEKRKPSAQPGGPTLRDSLGLALRDEAARRALKIVMSVRGGLPAQSYRFEFALAGSGDAQCHFACRLSKREGKVEKAMLEPKQVVAILKALQPALELPDEQPRFLPDTLIGILEVSDGTNTRRIYFAADPEQAKTQDQVPPAPLAAAIDAIYATAARLMGQRSVKP